MSELKPCPFCGRKVSFKHRPISGSDDKGWFVECACSVRFGMKADGIGMTKAEAAAAWNTRHVETCTVERNESGCNFAYRLYTLSCGHTVWTMGDAPNYCPTCGRKVEL